MTTPAMVIVHIDAQGSVDYLAAGSGLRLFIVDERAPHDRVYEWLPRNSIAQIEEVMPADSEVGSSADARHPAIANRLHAEWAGEHPFTVES
ncbi:hypothetical protein D3Y57_19020 [Sphingomonas paeninsulae]|uniref:Uncharacterized protein n=1 Tax=Sphingomonas paeninsulae TaxID=2319844 RepID=A0A494TDL5_SPHPE|nr:hypothetical protein [Sphingomonas paeninsulae]AYJ87629.1 hypothetical protein D3Y57_19020 [Sphingomonas paeninsulae]